MPKVRSHDRERVVAQTAHGMQERRPTVINPGFDKPEEEKEQERNKRRGLCDATGSLADDLELPSPDEARSWDNRFLSQRLREMEGIVDDPTSTGATGETGTTAQDFWSQQKLLPERLRALIEGRDTPPEGLQVVTREDLEGAATADFVDDRPTQQEEAAPPPPPPPDPPAPDPPSGDPPPQGPSGYEHLPPPPAPRERSRFERMVLSSGLAMAGAVTAYSSLIYANQLTDQATMSNAGMLAMAAGAAAPFVARKIYNVGGKVKKLLSKPADERGLSPAWEEFRGEYGWRKRQCKRWAKAGFTPEEAVAWDYHFATRPQANNGSHPAGGSAATVRQARDFRDFFGPAKMSAQDASRFIHAWITPGDLKDWVDRYYNPAFSAQIQITDEESARRRGEYERAFVDMVVRGHTLACQKYGYGHKSVDVAMREFCQSPAPGSKPIPPLDRFDKVARPQPEPFRRPSAVENAAFDGAMLGDSVY